MVLKQHPFPVSSRLPYRCETTTICAVCGLIHICNSALLSLVLSM